MADEERVRAELAKSAEVLEQMATVLEELLPKLRCAREALSESDAAVEGLGFSRVEAARLRLLEILQEPVEEISRPDIRRSEP